MGCGGSKGPVGGSGPPTGGNVGNKNDGGHHHQMHVDAKKDSTECDLSEQNLEALPVDDIGPDMVKINAADNKLKDLPPGVSKFMDLTVLDISGNEIATLPPEMGTLKKLEELLAFKNQIKELPKDLSGANLPELKVLNLFNNKLRKLPNELGTLAAVEEVNIAANKLMMVSDEAMVGWTQCKILSMYDNNLVRLGSLAPLKALTELRLYGNNLEEMPKIDSVPELEVLEIHKNRIATIPDDYFKAMPGLKRLRIDANQLTTLPPSICALPALIGLQAQENKITSLPSGSWSTKLETLFLQDNTDLADLPSELTNCSALCRFNIGKCSLSGASGAATADALGKICLAAKGGAYWGKDGRMQNGPPKTT